VHISLFTSVQLKRCWLRNTTAFRVEIMVVAAGDPNVGRPSGETQIFYVGDEVRE
jgi:hypothetical protein